MEVLDYFKVETCTWCHGRGFVSDTLCKICNGKGKRRIGINKIYITQDSEGNKIAIDKD